MKPDFLIIGAARSATTSLYLYLDPHPDVYLSEVKELNFFSNPKYWEKGLDWYERNFNVSRSFVAIGEASTSYTKAPFTENVPERIYNYNPDMKFIYIVRDPIDRLISHYLQRVGAGHESRELEDTIKNTDSESFLWQGKYHFQLEQYRRYFKKSQFLVISLDELKSHPLDIANRIYDFLGLDNAKVNLKIGKVYNSRKKVVKKSKFGLKVIKFYHQHIEQRRFPYVVKVAVTKLANFGGTTITKPQLSHLAKENLREFYRQDASELAKEYNVDIKGWFK